MSLLSCLVRLCWGCWGSHGDMVRERVKGRYTLVCQQCGHTVAFPRQRLRAKRLNVVTPSENLAQFPSRKKARMSDSGL